MSYLLVLVFDLYTTCHGFASLDLYTFRALHAHQFNSMSIIIAIMMIMTNSYQLLGFQNISGKQSCMQKEGCGQTP